jgi:hypothetical protein
MSERDSDRFDIDSDFLSDQEDPNDYERLLDRVEKRTRDKAKKGGKAAWAKLEEVLAERKLQREIADYDDYD